MHDKEIEDILEALLYVCGDEGLSIQDAARVLELTEDDASNVLLSCKETAFNVNRGLQIKQAGDRFFFISHKKAAPYIEKLAEIPERSALSQAALETLSIVAYNQPVTRTEVDDIRGVKSERAMQTLLQKALIAEAGRAQKTGRPILYQTTNRFMEYFGISSLEELPELSTTDNEEKANDADLFFDSLSFSNNESTS
ncbi:SMC-Scp complex subunit ScpB [Alteribacillus sp. HJP-4]|uniref:SMC-Scp complex subunit ScpB n=1 Tax=Alteribacillus sp. HJP-4 TaxID=2775394 RepID=UPI0035CD27FE